MPAGIKGTRQQFDPKKPFVLDPAAYTLYVHKLVSRFRGTYRLDDVAQAIADAEDTLLIACQRYDASQGVKPTTYIARCVTHALLNRGREQTRDARVFAQPPNRDDMATIDHMDWLAGPDTAEEPYRAHLREVAERLSVRERSIVRAHLSHDRREQAAASLGFSVPKYKNTLARIHYILRQECGVIPYDTSALSERASALPARDRHRLVRMSANKSWKYLREHKDDWQALFALLAEPHGNGCLLWKGPSNGAGSPAFPETAISDRNKRYQVRQMYWESHLGRTPARYLSPACGRPSCLAHLEPVRRGPRRPNVVQAVAQGTDGLEP